MLRLSHRPARDKRISTHVALVARACGAEGLYYSGYKDGEFEKSVKAVVDRFGGDFYVRHVNNAVNFVKKKKSEGFYVVHLTMYGLPFEDHTESLKKKKNILVIVGGEKVERIFYDVADLNLSVGSQPHSEVAAVGIFLYLSLIHI